MIYSRSKLGITEEVECDTLEEAQNEAIRDWASCSYMPLHITNESGKQVMVHAKLREFLLAKTGIGKFEPSWKQK